MISVLILIATVAIVGVVVWFVTTLPMPAIFKNLIYVIVCIAMILYLIHALQTGHLPAVRI